MEAKRAKALAEAIFLVAERTVKFCLCDASLVAGLPSPMVDEIEDAKARLALHLLASADTDEVATSLLRCETRCRGRDNVKPIPTPSTTPARPNIRRRQRGR